MGCRIIEGNGTGDSGRYAVLYCSVSMTAFGPVFSDYDEAEAFLAWHKDDPRRLSGEGIRDAYVAFREAWDAALRRWELVEKCHNGPINNDKASFSVTELATQMTKADKEGVAKIMARGVSYLDATIEFLSPLPGPEDVQFSDYFKRTCCCEPAEVE